MERKNVVELAQTYFGKAWEALADREQRVVRSIADRTRLSRPVRRELHDERTFGQRVADRVAAFGGSWSFIGLFAAVMLAWIVVNSVAVLGHFDPYPYILLNLVLSCLAAMQAPVIMMSQNRQGEIDRREAAHDYEVNLKAELEIMQLHEKVEAMRATELTRILEMQELQSRLIELLLAERKLRPGLIDSPIADELVQPRQDSELDDA